ncbi:DUF5694 domain-containing protein [Shewanella chilikensis]|uniref:DUF5694 domain-containing protein n=1 Tax=Shewanella chilikensis TaxID=558541 RepID=UPI003A9864DA
MTIKALLFLICLSAAGIVHITTAKADPVAAQAPGAEHALQRLSSKSQPKTQVMVLGSLHLSNIKQQLDSRSLSSILEPLSRYQPTAIAVESLRPEDIATMINGSGEYQTVLDHFVGQRFLALAIKEQQELQLSAQKALESLEPLLDKTSLEAVQRARLIKLAVAAYHKELALLHWHYLDKPAASTAISTELQHYLEQLAASNNEKNTLGNNLAMALKLKRIYPIDDHLDKDLYRPIEARLLESYNQSPHAAALAKSDYINKPQRLKTEALETGNWLPLFSWLNSQEYQTAVIDQEWSLFIDKDLPPDAALSRVALWEIRNLNMSSHIMRVVAANPGGRVLVIVGASHKVFLEQYLANMLGVKLIQPQQYFTAPQSSHDNR